VPEAKGIIAQQRCLCNRNAAPISPPAGRPIAPRRHILTRLRVFNHRRTNGTRPLLSRQPLVSSLPGNRSHHSSHQRFSHRHPPISPQSPCLTPRSTNGYDRSDGSLVLRSGAGVIVAIAGLDQKCRSQRR